jgi:hypothetical protein
MKRLRVPWPRFYSSGGTHRGNAPARACLARHGAADLEGVVLVIDEVGEFRDPTVAPMEDVVPVNMQMYVETRAT